MQKNQDRSASGTDADPLKSGPRIVSRDQDQRLKPIMTNNAAAMSSQRSHQGLRSFMLAQRQSQDIGCRLSFKTATANPQSRVDAGLSRASLLCAAPATAQSLSNAASRGIRTAGHSRSALFQMGNAELFGKWLSKKRCSSLSSWPDRIASSSIHPITNAKDVSKSAVGFIELPQTHRTASTFHDCRETIPMAIYWIEAEISGFLSTFRCWRGPSPARGGRDAHLTAGGTPALRRSVRLVGCPSGTAIPQTAPPYFSSLSNPAVLV